LADLSSAGAKGRKKVKEQKKHRFKAVSKPLQLCTGLVLVLIFGVSGVSQGKNYRSQMANVNGVKIHYLKAGTGKKPLVLIHGFGETSRMWIPLFEEFGKDYTMIAPDIRGLGDSSRPAVGYDKKTAAVDIRELVKSLGYQRIDLAGHDIGLMVAYAYAAQYPSEVEKLALLEAPIPGIGAVWEQIYTNPLLWHFHFVNSPIALDLVKGRERTFLEHFWQTLSANPKAFSETERQAYARSYAQEGAMKAAFEYFKAFNKQDAEDNRRFAANKLPMPVLVVAGDKSMGDALEIQAKLVADNVTAIKFADTGHWLMEERPVETKAALKKFFGPTTQANQP
jgi:pimeloyl-ACP methyl ester carboxylesterase